MAAFGIDYSKTYDACLVEACSWHGELTANAPLCVMSLYSSRLCCLNIVGKHTVRVKQLVLAVRCVCGVRMSPMR